MPEPAITPTQSDGEWDRTGLLWQNLHTLQRLGERFGFDARIFDVIAAIEKDGGA